MLSWVDGEISGMWITISLGLIVSQPFAWKLVMKRRSVIPLGDLCPIARQLAHGCFCRRYRTWVERLIPTC